MGKTKQFIAAVENKVADPTVLQRGELHAIAITEMVGAYEGKGASAALINTGKFFASRGVQYGLSGFGGFLIVASFEDAIRYMRDPERSATDDTSAGPSWTFHKKTFITGMALITTAIASGYGIIPGTFEATGAFIGNELAQIGVGAFGVLTEAAAISPILKGVHRVGKHVVGLHTKSFGSLFGSIKRVRNKAQTVNVQEATAAEAQVE